MRPGITMKTFIIVLCVTLNSFTIASRPIYFVHPAIASKWRLKGSIDLRLDAVHWWTAEIRRHSSWSKWSATDRKSTAECMHILLTLLWSLGRNSLVSFNDIISQVAAAGNQCFRLRRVRHTVLQAEKITLINVYIYSVSGYIFAINLHGALESIKP